MTTELAVIRASGDHIELAVITEVHTSSDRIELAVITEVHTSSDRRGT